MMIRQRHLVMRGFEYLQQYRGLGCVSLTSVAFSGRPKAVCTKKVAIVAKVGTIVVQLTFVFSK